MNVDYNGLKKPRPARSFCISEELLIFLKPTGFLNENGHGTVLIITFFSFAAHFNSSSSTGSREACSE